MKLETWISKATTALQQEGFTSKTISTNYCRHWQHLLNYARTRSSDSILNKAFMEDALSQRGERNLLSIERECLNHRERYLAHAMRSLLHFQAHGTFLSVPLAKSSKHVVLADYSIQALDGYLEFRKKEGDKERTLLNKERIIRQFLIKVSLERADDRHILDYISGLAHLEKHAARLDMNIVKKFLQFCHEKGFVQHEFSPLFPYKALPTGMEIPSVYSPHEIAELLDYLKHRKTPNQKRDYAIALMIAIFGIRIKDVADMNIHAIHWDNETITMTQSKTGKEVIYNIPPVVGNALVDYLLNERQESQETCLFLKGNGGRFHGCNSVRAIIVNAFINSSVEIKGRKYGSHCLRHSLASNLLAQDTSILIISKVLGHSSVNSTRVYAKVDIRHLRMCELEVPSYEQ
jgi:integrase/recombinase XerD